MAAKGNASAELYARAVRAIRQTVLLRRAIRDQDAGLKALAPRNAEELVIHDLANSLAAAQLCAAALAERHARSTDRSPDQLAILRRSLQQMEELLSDLRDARQMVLGRFVVELGGPVAPAQLVSSAIESARPWAGERRIVADCAADLGPVCVDERRLQRVFGNLIGNAVKFTARDGVIAVGAKAGPTADRVTFFVRDDGEGISEADQARIFEPYWQAGPTRRQGSGLGLTICKGIVEAHGGVIAVASRPGGGSTFAFTLPCASKRADAAWTDAASELLGSVAQRATRRSRRPKSVRVGTSGA